MSDWLTTLSSIRARDPDWKAIAAYEVPVRRYLRQRFPRLPKVEQDDLLQEILLAMRERIVPRYDAEAGAFRAFLKTSISNAVRDHLRRKRARPELPTELEASAEPAERDLEALDLEALLVGAVQRVHDRFSHGSEADLSAVYVLSGVLVDGLSNRALARREGLSIDQVKRTLQRARAEILGEVFQGLLGAKHLPERGARCAELTRACLRSPRKAARLLERERDPACAEAVEALVRRLRDARTSLRAEEGVDLLEGIEAVFCG